MDWSIIIHIGDNIEVNMCNDAVISGSVLKLTDMYIVVQMNVYIGNTLYSSRNTYIPINKINYISMCVNNKSSKH